MHYLTTLAYVIPSIALLALARPAYIRLKALIDARRAASAADESARLLHGSRSLSGQEVIERPKNDKVTIEHRAALTVHNYKDELLAAVAKHPVLIVVGEPGSGRTTQIPQYLHEAGYTRHGRGQVAVALPRRGAAVRAATRVSEEMGTALGQEVGYEIRDEDRTSGRTVIRYMTDGALAREIVRDAGLKGYAVVMVDGLEETTENTDAVLAGVKAMSAVRGDVKVLVCPGGEDANKYSKYFDDAPVFKIARKGLVVQL
ncbi:putative pre-mRNA-splicing factor ATP-dependent RNA helicase dhx16 [Irineochytrium annulatum]|nr:putative pre-mRNA-splicing factor ATP-dependent RNA helicase dhx16 [Irineochytrium annulatum]